MLGIIKENRFHDEVIAAARMTGTNFIVNVIKNFRGEIIEAVAGELEKAHMHGVEVCEKYWIRKVKKAYDIVFVSAGSYPKDVDLHQSQKGLVVAGRTSTKPRGNHCSHCRMSERYLANLEKFLKEADSVDAVIEDFLRSGSSEDNKGKSFFVC